MATQASTADLVAALSRVDGKAEIVGGEIVLMPPTGGIPSRAAAAMYRSLWGYTSAARGRDGPTPTTSGSRWTFQRKSFSPDASFHVGPPPGPKFLQGAPIFAAEVRSEDDYGPAAERAMAQKRADYFAAGSQAVWDVDVLREGLVRVYRAMAPDVPTVYRRGELAVAEPALPGWSFPVDDLFE